MKDKILVTGGSGRFGLIFKKFIDVKNFYFPTKKQLDILNEKKIIKIFNKIKPKIVIHLAGLSRPMSIHEKDIKKSIDLNIIGTSNIVKACKKKNIKLIYFSTNYVYPGRKGNYKEEDPLLPVNKYAWSKLGGEAAVHMYSNSLILRVCMTEKPFVHKAAFANVKTNFMFHEDVVPILSKVLRLKGVLNLGGKGQSIFEFAKKENRKVKKIFLKKNKKNIMPLNSTMNLKKLKNILKRNKNSFK